MLAVFGAGGHAAATAAHAAVVSNEEVILDRGVSGSDASHGRSGWTAETAGGSRVRIQLRLGDCRDADVILWLARPRELHFTPPAWLFETEALVLYAPGTFSGWESLRRLRGGANVHRVGVLSGFPAIGDIFASDAHIRIRGTKQGLSCGAARHDVATSLCELLGRWFTHLIPTGAMEAEFNSTNVIVHGPLLIGHLADLSNSESAPALFYRGAAFRVGSELVESVDQERRDIGASIGLLLPRARDLLIRQYGHLGMRGTSIAELHESFSGLAESLAPKSFEHRYMTDDVAFGLACWEALALRQGVPSPVISAVITVLEHVSGTDLREWAPGLAARAMMGIEPELA